MNERRHEPVFPGFAEMAAKRRAVTDELAERRQRLGLSQTQVAARMGTSQSAVARLERYAAALGHQLDITLKKEQP